MQDKIGLITLDIQVNAETEVNGVLYLHFGGPVMTLNLSLGMTRCLGF